MYSTIVPDVLAVTFNRTLPLNYETTDLWVLDLRVQGHIC